MASMFQIEKQDAENYESWCLQMRSVLTRNGFWKIVNGVLKKESTMNVNEKATWDKSN